MYTHMYITSQARGNHSFLMSCTGRLMYGNSLSAGEVISPQVYIYIYIYTHVYTYIYIIVLYI